MPRTTQGNPTETPLFPYTTWTDSYGQATPVYLIPLDSECNIPDPYADPWGEQAAVVDSGRLNLSRTTQYVLDAAYDEALTTINTATSIGLDPAGRLLLYNLKDELGNIIDTEKIIDAPRDNLALYQRLMKEGCLSAGGVSLSAVQSLHYKAGDLGYLVCSSTAPEKPTTDDLKRAASFLAGAADKFGHLGVDEVIYINSALGINQVATQPDGSLIISSYFDFNNALTYDRAIYEGTTADLLQPVEPYTDLSRVLQCRSWDSYFR